MVIAYIFFGDAVIEYLYITKMLILENPPTERSLNARQKNFIRSYFTDICPHFTDIRPRLTDIDSHI